MIEFKRGDTFYLYITLRDENQEPINLGVENISCQIRKSVRRGVGLSSIKELVDTFTITSTDTIGVYKFSVEDTSNYPVAILDSDIEFNIEGKIISSETFQIKVIEDVTII